MIIAAVVTVIAAYLLGSLNFAVIYSKAFTKKDVRELGSGNAGTTNVMRAVGVTPGILTFVCDAFKGFAACYLGSIVFEYIAKSEPSFFAVPIYGAYICGVACMLGHIFPIFFKFKGGKGVATSVGIFAVCCPIAIAIGLAVFALCLVLSKIVSLSSLTATVTVVVLSVIFADKTVSVIPQIIMAVIMGCIVFIKHKDNIKRLALGNEKKITVKR